MSIMCFFRRFIAYKSSNSIVSMKENTNMVIRNFERIIETKNNASALDMIKFFTNSIQGELVAKSFYNDRTYSDYIGTFKHSILLDINNSEVRQCNFKVRVQNTPVISAVWKVDWGWYVANIGLCNENPFKFEDTLQNVKAILVNPLGLVMVESGNHSVNAAIVHNEGEILVKSEVDISSLLEKYAFYGNKYIVKDTRKSICDPKLINGVSR